MLIATLFPLIPITLGINMAVTYLLFSYTESCLTPSLLVFLWPFPSGVTVDHCALQNDFIEALRWVAFPTQTSYLSHIPLTL